LSEYCNIAFFETSIFDVLEEVMLDEEEKDGTSREGLSNILLTCLLGKKAAKNFQRYFITFSVTLLRPALYY